MNDRIRSYTYLYPAPGNESPGFWVDPDAAAEAAVRFMNMGFTAVKFDPAGPYTIRGGHEPAMSDITRSIAFCKAIREAEAVAAVLARIGPVGYQLTGVTDGERPTAGPLALVDENGKVVLGLGTYFVTEMAVGGGEAPGALLGKGVASAGGLSLAEEERAERKRNLLRQMGRG